MKLVGKAVSKGVAAGPVLRYKPFQATPADVPIEEDGVEQALRAYDETLARAKAELDALEARMKAGDPDKAAIIYAHREILMDPAMDEEIRALISDELMSPDAAVDKTFGAYIAVLGNSNNELMRERVSDLRDVRNRLLRCWAGEREHNLSSLPRPVVVVADDLYPSDTVSLDRDNVLGIITQVGGATSHTAIIARGYEIPAVLGVAGAMEKLSDGETVVLDAVEGEVVTTPDEEALAAYAAKRARVRAELLEVKTELPAEPVTRDGRRIQTRLNLAAADGHELSGARHADGCGLFRTEFLYLGGERAPGEDEQYQAYRRVLEAFGDKPVVLRTLDVGGDKRLSCLEAPREENPFLGARGLRLCLDCPALFRVQIRAALRASAHGNLRIMLPMVGALDEVRAARALLAEEGAALDAAGIEWNHHVPIGVMLEVPSAALIADAIAAEVDFASVGTNDLTQYLCAADRMNPAVKPYYQEYHPALFRLLGHVARTFRAAGKDVSVCGELGGDPLAVPVLAGLGFDQLSMSLSSMAACKRVIRRLDMGEAEALAAEVVKLRTEGEIRARLQAFARR